MTKAQKRYELVARLRNVGFTYEEANQLRRIEMTLQRWSEQECGDSNEYASYSIERDEKTGKPFRCIYPNRGEMRRYPVADREAGALKRCKAILAARNERVKDGNALSYYHQSDPRGCALYLLRASDLHDSNGAALPADSYYNRGLAVCD